MKALSPPFPGGFSLSPAIRDKPDYHEHSVAMKMVGLRDGQSGLRQ